MTHHPSTGNSSFIPSVRRGRVHAALDRGRAIAAILFDLDGTLIETDDQAVERFAGRLKPVRRFLPDRDTRAARRLIMHNHDFLNRWLVRLDRLGWTAASSASPRVWGCWMTDPIESA